jgi:hypothetical protein
MEPQRSSRESEGRIENLILIGMNMKKIAVLIIVFFFLALGSFFVARNINFNGKKEILAKIQQNEENQIETITGSAESDSDSASKTNEEIISGAAGEETKNNDVKMDVLKEEISENLPKIINKLVGWGHETAPVRSIDTIIIHSSYNAMGGDQYSVEKLIGEYKGYGVSPHYLIDRKGAVYRLVEDKNIAYHAGVSKVPDGRNNVNSFSIGIEMMNAKDDKCTLSQYDTLKRLITSLKSKYSIKYILGHSDIAKGRKDDPWNFEWNKLK